MAAGRSRARYSSPTSLRPSFVSHDRQRSNHGVQTVLPDYRFFPKFRRWKLFKGSIGSRVSHRLYLRFMR
ncbi:Protein of unknown function [Pyronema omphalodes CBS 100304]|uniref:Uncharacterized protein n=1 Tax=Pyronema omphalodes (strain CBS 100304) TaxID=1076935 RepID=U4LRF4_PYROM|nr:Protein of unknown function [Pyronema omphalodes CBS 100304]